MSKPDNGETAIDEENVITNKSAQNKSGNKIKEENQDINLNKNFNLEEDFQSSSSRFPNPWRGKLPNPS